MVWVRAVVWAGRGGSVGSSVVVRHACLRPPSSPSLLPALHSMPLALPLLLPPLLPLLLPPPRVQVLRLKGVRPYIPDFKLAFEHFCVHTGGRGVIDAIEKQLELREEHVRASRETLYRYGNVSSSSVWCAAALVYMLFAWECAAAGWRGAPAAALAVDGDWEGGGGCSAVSTVSGHCMPSWPAPANLFVPALPSRLLFPLCCMKVCACQH